MSKILIVGATGMLGSEICRRLAAAGKPVWGLVRRTSDPAKVSKLHSFGVKTQEGDVRDRASLDQACKGASAVICTVSAMPFSYQPGLNDINTVDRDGIFQLIEAAKAQHVSHFVYTSIPEMGRFDCPLNRAKREIEQRLMKSGLEYTILRPSYFMEAWLTPVVGFEPANAKATIYGTGENPISWIAVEDVAKFAISSLEHPAAKNAILDLGGPQELSPLAVVELFEQAGGRRFELQFVPEEALEAQQAATNDPMQETFSALMRLYASGNPIDMSNTLQTFGIQPTSVAEYVERVLTPASS